MPKGERSLAWLAFLIVCVVWGTTYLAIAIAIETLPTFLFPGLRFILGGLILLALCLWKRQRIPARAADWANATFVGFLMVGLGNVCVVWAEHHVPSGFAALFVATAPLWMVLLERLRPDGDRVSVRKWIGMVVGFGGVALLVWPALTGASYSPQFVIGVILIQIGSIGWNVGAMWSKYRPLADNPLVSAAMQMIMGGLVVSLIGLALGEASEFHFTTRTFLAFAYLVIFGSVIAFGAFVYAISHLPTTTVTLHTYVNPVVALLLGWMILSEPFGPRAAIASLIIFAGVAIVQSSRRAAPGSPLRPVVDEGRAGVNRVTADGRVESGEREVIAAE